MIRALVLLAALAAGPAAAQAPDWCGARGLNAAERTICTTAALQWRDEAVNRLWQTTEGGAGLEVSQDEWLGRRNSCGTDVSCLIRSYDARIFDLRTLARIGDDPPLRPWCGTSGLSATEATICDIPLLANYDAALQRLSDSLGQAAPNPDPWVANRDACGADTACIENAYLDRFATLGEAARIRE